MPPRLPQRLRAHGYTDPWCQLADGRFAWWYYDAAGHRILRRFRTVENMREDHAETRRLHRNGETKAVGLRPVQWSDAAEAIALLGPGETLLEVVKSHRKRHPLNVTIPPTADIVAELVARAERRGRSAKYLRDIRRDLADFAAAHPCLSEAGEQQIETYLHRLPCGPRRRNNIRDAIVTVSRYARARKYLPDEITPAEKVPRINAGHDVQTFEPQEMALYLEHISDRWLPRLVLGAFAGLRASEVYRVETAALKWDLRVIAVKAKVAKKVRISRKVPMSDNLVNWLAPLRDKQGPIYPNKETHGYGLAWSTLEKQFSREIERLEKLTGLRWKENALRHSYGSNRLAIVKDEAQVALEMGTSPSRIRENYHDPKSEDEGRAWFALNPPRFTDNILPLPLEFR